MSEDNVINHLIKVKVANSFFQDGEEGEEWHDVVSIGHARDGTAIVTFETADDSPRPGVYAIAAASTFYLGVSSHEY